MATAISSREDSALRASQTATIASVGFMAAYDPQAAEQFNASRKFHWIADREHA
jgi:hypothetical protein